MRSKSIGGYFDLELGDNKKPHFFNRDTVKLNSGRNCLKYILISQKYSKIYIPYFTCKAVVESIIKVEIPYEFYDVDDELEPIFDFDQKKKEEAFLYTNYFGIKDSYVSKLASSVCNLIVDNAQAYYSEPIKNIDTFYSPRKFFGLPDGGILYTNKKLTTFFKTDVSYDRIIILPICWTKSISC